MNLPNPEFIRSTLSGNNISPKAKALRLFTSLAEPFYAAAVLTRNAAFSHQCLAAHHLGRRTISVGNITTGGTGKTPVVLWLAKQLQQRGLRPAVLLRGYRITQTGISDEQQLLEKGLNSAQSTPVAVRANPSRVKSARQLLAECPQIDVFILDDGFQHHKVHRDFDLVLINAAEPFGFGHLLPRGLLREPLGALGRADAIIITHVSQVPSTTLDNILRRIRQFQPASPIYFADHAHTSVRTGSDTQPITALNEKRCFVFSGIGDPKAFIQQLQSHGANIVGSAAFIDHHDYSADDLRDIQNQAASVNAQYILTTEKDWMKISAVAGPSLQQVPISVVEMEIQFHNNAGEQLLKQILSSPPR